MIFELNELYSETAYMFLWPDLIDKFQDGRGTWFLKNIYAD